MGNRLAPLLAIAYMDKLERRSVDRDVILYKRYIDDIIVITDSEEKLQKVFNDLHQDNIRLTRESPDDQGWLPYLNMALQFDEDGFKSKWYRKAAKRDLMIRRTSAHPEGVKLQTIKNMIRTAKDVSSAAYKDESEKMALAVARANDYTEDDIASSARGPRYIRGAAVLRIPFISDRFSIKIQKIFARYRMPVNIAVKPPPTLKQILVRSRLYDSKCDGKGCQICTEESGICKIKGVVYQLTCTTCSAIYIGETGRTLAERIKEHLADMRFPDRNKPWSLHVKNVHDGCQVNVKVNILTVERRLQERKIKEAIFIKSLKPAINGRKEMAEAVKFLPM